MKTAAVKLPTVAQTRNKALKKFRVWKRKDEIICVVSVPPGTEEYRVVQIAKNQQRCLEVFRIPPRDQSEVSSDLMLGVELQTAIKFARYVARHQKTPTIRRRQWWRRRCLRKAVNRYNQHMDVKTLLKASLGELKPPKMMRKPFIRTYVILYDPKSALGEEVFRIHSAGCSLLTRDRARVIRHEGASWVFEGQDAKDVVKRQVREFDEDNKGYDASDFFIHTCDVEGRG